MELAFDVAGYVRVQAAEDDVAVAEVGCLALAHDQIADGWGDGLGLFPLDGIAIFLSGRPGGGADGNEAKGGMLLEEEDEALADGPGAAQDALSGLSATDDRIGWKGVREER